MPFDEWVRFYRPSETQREVARRLVEEVEAMVRGDRLASSVPRWPGARR